jgi:ELWxxDGT repeat protein
MKPSVWRRWCNARRRARSTDPAARAGRRQPLGLEALEDRVTPSLTPQMILDINTNTLSSNPSQLLAVGSTTFFTVGDGVNEWELWKSDGSPAGTALVKGITANGAGSDIGWLTNVNGTLFFTTYDGTHGTALWKSDGTAVGTVLLKDIFPAFGGPLPSYLTNAGGTLFFSAYDGNGTELWKSDGTAAGTVLVKDINTGSYGSSPGNLTNAGGTLFFTAYTPATGSELWKSDGSAAGTVLVRDTNPGGAGSNPRSLTNASGTLFFSASDDTGGTELWKSDGTAAGTMLVKDLYPGGYSSLPLHLTNLNGALLFEANDGTTGNELWRSDGSASGTSLVKDVNLNLADSNPGHLTAVGGTLFFTANDGTTGYELWRSDGTSAGTRLVKDIYPGGDTYDATWPGWLTNVGGMVFFTAGDGMHGTELWKSDGTPTGTVLVKDIIPGSGGALPGSLTNFNGRLFFAASDDQHGTELWKSDGTAVGTGMVKDIDPRSFGSNPSGQANVNGTLFFAAADDVHGVELWKSNGTAAGTSLVKDLYPGGAGSNPSGLMEVNGTLFFTAYSHTTEYSGPALWKSDGTEAGTVLVSSLSGSASRLTNASGTLMFSLEDGTHGAELWKSDGTAAGTTLVKDLYPGTHRQYDYYGNWWYVPNSSDPSLLTNVNGTLFFTATDGVRGRELWKSDGTAAGTTLVKDTRPGPSSAWRYAPQYLTNVNGTLFFTANDGMLGRELWKSNGTESGTVQVKDIYSGGNGSSPRYLANINGTLFFTAYDGTTGWELRRSDGTAAGTTLIKDINPGSTSSWASYLTNVNGTLFFSAYDAATGWELWKSDGTATGTVLVKDMDPGSGSYSPHYLTNVGGTLFFTADDGTGVWKLWQSDGTATGTVFVADLVPVWLTNVNGTLFFSADDGTHGRELWKLADGLPALTVGDATVTEGNAGTRAATFTVTLSAASNQPVTVSYATANGAATAPSDYAAISGMLTFAPGETSKTVIVLVKGDRRGEPNELFYLALSAPGNATIADGQGQGTILDDEPRITISDASGLEGNAGTVAFTFTVSLSSTYDAPVTVHFSTANGSATAGSDYQAASGTLTFAPGQTSQTITVLVIGDRLGEANETFRVNLSAATSALITDSYGVGTILDDEPRLTISDVRKQEGNGGTRQFVFTVRLSAAYDQPVTVSFQTADGTATTSDNDYVSQSGTLTFNPGETSKTITILVNGETKKEADELFYVDLFGNSSNAWLAKSRGIGTIVNDD